MNEPDEKERGNAHVQVRSNAEEDEDAYYDAGSGFEAVEDGGIRGGDEVEEGGEAQQGGEAQRAIAREGKT